MTTEEFVKQLNNKEDYIILEGDRANDVYRIVAAGGVAAGKAILNSVRNNYKITEKVEDKDGKVIRLALKRK